MISADRVPALLDHLTGTCDARGWRLRVSYGPGRPAWTASVGGAVDVPYLWGAGATQAEALEDCWAAVQRWCRELAATGPARRAGA